MKDSFVLSGFINTFNIVPAFVTPVFKRKIEDEDEDMYFVQYVDNNKIILDVFSDFSDSFYLSKVKFYECSKYKTSDLNGTILSTPIDYNRINNIYFDLKEPIFGFQTKEEIVYGREESFTNFLNKFETDDKYLKEEINDFKENIDKFKINEYKVSVKETSVPYVFSAKEEIIHPFDLKGKRDKFEVSEDLRNDLIKALQKEFNKKKKMNLKDAVVSMRSSDGILVSVNLKK